MNYEYLDTKVIGSRIKEIRKKLGFFQDDFAKSLIVSPATLSEVENGKTKAGFDILYNLVAVHNVNLDYVFFGKGDLFKPAESPDSSNDTDSPKISNFGEFAIDVKEILDLMGKSKLFLGYIVTMGKEYIYGKSKIIKTDIHRTQNNLSLNNEFENIE